MGLDAIAKRYFPVWVCGLIATAAYFQADGVGALIGGTIGRAEPPSAPKSKSRAPTNTQAKPKSADSILARNAFDSVTGPLDGKVTQVGATNTEPLPPVNNGADPYADPPCTSVRVSLVTASDDDPAWSFASLSHEGKSMLRRTGDKIGDAEVVHIGWYPTATEPSPRVWLQQGGSRCIVEWGGADATPKKVEPPKTDSKAPDSKSRVPPELESKIHKKSDTEYDVERSAVAEIIKNYAQLAAGLRARQTKDGGVRLSGIKGNSILNSLGMKNGDILRSINGYDMSDQDKALEAYAKLKTAKQLTIVLDRDKSPLTVSIGIK
ncbi:MAG: type II secretion system protein GspC [Polyangiaceae bacterium]